MSRDREDELAGVARVLKQAGAGGGAALDRRALVFKRPLPYVYLARDVFADAGIPYQTFDALPLAAEPYAAALDLVFEFVTSEFTREPVVALLSSPHFQFTVDGSALGALKSLRSIAPTARPDTSEASNTCENSRQRPRVCRRGRRARRPPPRKSWRP